MYDPLADLQAHPRTLIFAVLIYGGLALALHAERARARAPRNELEAFFAELGFPVRDEEWDAFVEGRR